MLRKEDGSRYAGSDPPKKRANKSGGPWPGGVGYNLASPLVDESGALNRHECDDFDESYLKYARFVIITHTTWRLIRTFGPKADIRI